MTTTTESPTAVDTSVLEAFVGIVGAQATAAMNGLLTALGDHLGDRHDDRVRRRLDPRVLGARDRTAAERGRARAVDSAAVRRGMHFLGRFGDEATLFRLAAQLEAANPWAGRWPPINACSVH